MMRQGTESTKQRPITVTLLAIAVLIIAAVNLVRVWATAKNWETLTNLGVSPGPVYIALTGAFWAIAFLILFELIWTGHPKARMSSFIAIGLYIAYYWLDRLAFQSRIPQKNTPFAIGMTILVVFYTLLSLSLPATKAFLSRKNEQ
jgi:hypothetical protein